MDGEFPSYIVYHSYLAYYGCIGYYGYLDTWEIPSHTDNSNVTGAIRNSETR
jgi:hypothetical protein